MPDTQYHAFKTSLSTTGACGDLIRARDWSATALGPMEDWPTSLRTVVSLILRSPLPMALLWGETGVMLYNDPYSRFAGGRHPGLLGFSVREGWQEMADFNDHLLRAVLSGKSLHYRDLELTLNRHGTPEPVWIDLDGSPVIDESGQAAGVLCILGETTERIASERRQEEVKAALAESEARFRSMVDTVPQIIWIADADGRMEFLNRQFSIYTGAPFSSMSPSEIAGAFIHPEDAPHVVAAFQAAREEERPHACEHRIRSATGQYRWFLDRAEPYRDPRTGRIVRWFGASVDIHDRKIAEDALRDMNASLEKRVAQRTSERNILATLVENTDVMVMAIDHDYNILAINAANADEFERIFGIRPKAGDNMLELLIDRPELREEVRAGWALGLTGERVDFIEEFGDPDRVRPYYEIKFRPLHDETGRQVGTYQFVTDVTERLRQEAQLFEGVCCE